MSLINQIKNNTFFYNTCLRNRDDSYESVGIGAPQVKNFLKRSDTEEFFKENLKTQPADWYYRTNEIIYNLNSFGYRAPAFENIKWEDSVIMFGCSNVFGVGLYEKDTISYCLSELINLPVINMGCPGTSIDFSLYNSIILKNICPKPRGVIHLWTQLYRTTYYSENMPKSFGVWGGGDKEYWNEYVKEHSHSATNALFASMISKHLWNNTTYYEASMYNNTAKTLNCDNFSEIYNSFKDKGDKARDLKHSGRLCAKAIAGQIAHNLKL